MIYVLIWEDRHVDADVRLFGTYEKAVAEARKLARENLDHYRIPSEDLSQYEDLNPEMERAGWLYHIRLHDDGPTGRVQAREVQ